MIRRHIVPVTLMIMAGLFVWAPLVACGTTPEVKPPGTPPAATYSAGGAYDAEEYTGPAQKVVGWDYEDAEYGTRTKRVPDGRETYCKSYKNGKCTGTATRTRYKNVTESYETDDADWYVILADGTRIDCTREQQAAHPVESMWP